MPLCERVQGGVCACCQQDLREGGVLHVPCQVRHTAGVGRERGQVGLPERSTAYMPWGPPDWSVPAGPTRPVTVTVLQDCVAACTAGKPCCCVCTDQMGGVCVSLSPCLWLLHAVASTQKNVLQPGQSRQLHPEPGAHSKAQTGWGGPGSLRGSLKHTAVCWQGAGHMLGVCRAIPVSVSRAQL